MAAPRRAKSPPKIDKLLAPELASSPDSSPDLSGTSVSLVSKSVTHTNFGSSSDTNNSPTPPSPPELLIKKFQNRQKEADFKFKPTSNDEKLKHWKNRLSPYVKKNGSDSSKKSIPKEEQIVSAERSGKSDGAFPTPASPSPSPRSFPDVSAKKMEDTPSRVILYSDTGSQKKLSSKLRRLNQPAPSAEIVSTTPEPTSIIMGSKENISTPITSESKNDSITTKKYCRCCTIRRACVVAAVVFFVSLICAVLLTVLKPGRKSTKLLVKTATTSIDYT